MNSILSRLPVVLLSLMLLAGPGSPSRAQSPAPAGNARVIVKYKVDSPLLRRETLAAGSPRMSGREALSQRVGLSLRAGADVAERTQVLFASGMTSRALAARLARENDVEFAVPDERRHRFDVPNDPLYLTGPAIAGNTGGPVAGQWYLRAPAGEVQSSIDVEPAWTHTTGAPGVVVAVLDTGVRFDHADLLRVGAGGNMLSGYDMIQDPEVANDGDGRDADPSDPGDWLTQAEVTQSGGPFDDCGNVAEDSSWHGTQTAGIIAALTGNGIGMASVGRNVRVLPVRVLGKCGGFDSDIIAGMRWAVGLSVAGVPANPNPARVLNMSLGSEGACTAAYMAALSEVMAMGAVVVASAGNSAGHAVSTPANCPGVIAVAGLRHAGTKVGFSDLGPEIALSAPGGNCVDIGPNDACRYPILTTTNPGPTTPVPSSGGGSTYTDAFNASIGTSFAAPLVAGTVALMFSAQPALSASTVRSLLQSTARAFPTSGGDTGEATTLPQCTVPRYNGTTPIDQLQCYCTTSACGAGMLDAGAAVIAALGLQAHIAVSPVAPVAGQAVTFSAAPSVVTSGHGIVAYRWEIVSGGGIVAGFAGATNGSTATAVTSGAGTFSVRLTVTDNAGLVATTVSVVNVGAFNSNPVGGTAAFDRLNFQGMWWNAPAGSEAGWGINFAHQGEVIFATWFTHDLNGKAWN
ncbi:MAG: S8 family serine peptidase, partial [Casimicrobiaceae bacterium]